MATANTLINTGLSAYDRAGRQPAQSTLMALGQFVFGLSTLAYDELKRSSAWRHPATSRVGARAARQYVGVGDDTITLSGWVAPELVGSAASIDELRAMGDAGSAYALVTGTGDVLGQWVIESLSETGTQHAADGTPARIAFDLQLARVDDQAAGAAVEQGETGQLRSTDRAAQ